MELVKVPEVPLKLKKFLESSAFNSQQKAYNLLRGQGSVETKDSGISKQSFQWADYNIVLPSYKTILRMSATERFYTHTFFKVHHAIIQAILSRKSMKKITVTDEKIFCVCKAFDRKL